LDKVVREADVSIKNAQGLHLRPAMKFVDIASRYRSDIQVSNAETTVDGKSIMQMSTLAAIYGTKLKIRTEGEDAEALMDALRELVEVKMFDEPPPSDSVQREAGSG